ncbi:guanylate-binding protein 5-like [Oncorhynchus kisutch]|uniref:guanylate-binding protein 5-like n=1 Tax=Oncorhynchus kisutch TaxID=8019 RepID=UPI0012DD7452|nr:guanylate-binding protein 5-like [Oncorhynchus kisutch]
MAKKITEGIYELYCNHHENMLAQYRAKPDKGVGAEEILEQFRKEKSLEKYSILQADRKMDRKLEKEKEGSAVLIRTEHGQDVQMFINDQHVRIIRRQNS